MRIPDHVRLSIDLWERQELNASMLFACIAVDGTARKLHPNKGNKDRFTSILRDNYSVLGPMGVPGINLEQTRFPVTVRRPTSSDGKPDIADVLYGVHRCCLAHGDELPDGFEFIRNAAGPSRITEMQFSLGRVRFSDRIIFGLLAVAVLSPANNGQTTPALNGYHLTYGSQPKLMINDWWGRVHDFPAIVAQDPTPQVKLDFGNWIA